MLALNSRRGNIYSHQQYLSAMTCAAMHYASAQTFGSIHQLFLRMRSRFRRKLLTINTLLVVAIGATVALASLPAHRSILIAVAGAILVACVASVATTSFLRWRIWTCAAEMHRRRIISQGRDTYQSEGDVFTDSSQVEQPHTRRYPAIGRWIIYDPRVIGVLLITCLVGACLNVISVAFDGPLSAQVVSGLFVLRSTLFTVSWLLLALCVHSVWSAYRIRARLVRRGVVVCAFCGYQLDRMARAVARCPECGIRSPEVTVFGWSPSKDII